MTADFVLGIDIGGTGIKLGIVDVREGRLVGPRKRALTPQPAVPDKVATAVRQLMASPDFPVPTLAGVGFPAVIKNGIARSSANVDRKWIGTDVAEVVSEAVGMATVAVNDADAAGLAEVRFGAGRGEPGVVVMVTLGTGIGTGLFWRGQLVPNSELGHIELRGKDAEKRAAASVRERRRLTWSAWAARVEEYLRVLDGLLSPDLVIIGGGVSAVPEKFLPKIKVQVRVVPAKLGNDAGIVGAALFAAESFGAGSGEPSRPAAY